MIISKSTPWATYLHFIEGLPWIMKVFSILMYPIIHLHWLRHGSYETWVGLTDPYCEVVGYRGIIRGDGKILSGPDRQSGSFVLTDRIPIVYDGYLRGSTHHGHFPVV